MKLDTTQIPSGLSWGMRGFRVGKAASGRWWISIGLPFGFRYFFYLKNIDRKKTQQIISNDSLNTLNTTGPSALEETRLDRAHKAPSKLISKNNNP
jgi:hypothetical protein